MPQAARQRGFQPELVLVASRHASLENLKLIRPTGWEWLAFRLIKPTGRSVHLKGWT